MSLARALLLSSSYPKRRGFVRDCRAPERAQARVWRETWDEIGGSPFWQDAMGSRAGGPRPSLASFPLTTYEDYREALELSFDRPWSLLSGSDIAYWSVSAGSTGPRKLFPITEPYREQFQRTTPPFLHGLARAHRGLLRKPVLYFAGSMPQERSPAGVDVGFISNYNYRNIPAFLRRLYAFPVEVLRDGETFFEWGPLYALATDLSAMVGITPAIMVRFFERMIAQMDRYWPILEGIEDPPAPLPKVSVSPARLRLLRAALRDGTPCFADLWPGLSAVVCWKASTCGMQLPALERFVQGRVPVIDATYSATEGWINVPGPDGSPGGPIHPGAHVFEFLPVGCAPKPHHLLRAWELEAGREYEIVLTTAMGLVRYRLFDIVSCTGHFERSPIIRFVQKSSSEISLGPACVSETELCDALRASGVSSDAALFAPSPSGNRIQLLYWTDGTLPDIEAIERSLRSVNAMYRKYVGDGSLAPLELRVLAKDHPVLARDEHAQMKPRVLLREPVL